MGKLPKAAHSSVFKTRLRALKTEQHFFIHLEFFIFYLSWGKSVLTQIYRNPPFCFIPPFLLAMHDIQA